MIQISWGKVIPWILVAALLIFIIFGLKACGKPNTDGPAQDSVTYWKTKTGEAVASLRAAEAQFAIAPKPYRDSIAALLDTKDKLLKEIVDIKLHGKVILVPVDTGKDKLVIQYRDTGHTQIEVASQVFSNPWYMAKVQLNLLDGTKSLVEIQSYDSLLLVWKTVRSGWFLNRKDSLQLDIKNSNPYNQITGAKAYRVPSPAPKKWAIGLMAGWGYGFNAVGGNYGYPIIGVGLMRTLIRF